MAQFCAFARFAVHKSGQSLFTGPGVIPHPKLQITGTFELRYSVTARVISGVASHIQVEETEALHVSRIALMVRGYLRSECVKE
ncbi:MAG: hypothetical protein BECKG1743E_GA0114224_107871, partial [Candidatus Kentron sp. G]